MGDIECVCNKASHNWICVLPSMTMTFQEFQSDMDTSATFIHDLQEWMYMVSHETTSAPLHDECPLDLDALNSLVLDSMPCITDSESLVSDTEMESTVHGLSPRPTKHTGLNKCQVMGCSRRAKRGNFCPIHGGAKCCRVQWCANSAQTQGLCKAHGGGPRCTVPGCDKSSQGRGLCRAHGGGKRCSHEGCTRGVQRGNKCATHGGVRVCMMDGCSRMDRGGGLCEVHRREHKCIVSGCTRLHHIQNLCKLHLRKQIATLGTVNIKQDQL
ncbi:hypothetical protein Ae201684P_006915 [Aphanomyces euteiches]|uniref:WRKY19-like zinc finger domain-containing protein n=1 Tax=Aphanomyces euteiches TaxID=100861 RepID=A0A6G0X8F9_9STRA|nr:hypothetical protein Ae201684_007351 [Aphanomyces euteiches]KAH9100721.1 hypothetical protein Ae201684P_006915 [Aphanomyces euteiches]